MLDEDPSPIWSRPTPARPASLINVTPLVDVVLVLLIIFMVVTPRLETDGRIMVPEVAHGGDPSPIPPNALLLSLSSRGRVTLDGQPVARDELLERLRRARAAAVGERPLVLRADRAVSYGAARRLLQLARQAGFPGASLRVVERASAVSSGAARGDGYVR